MIERELSGWKLKLLVFLLPCWLALAPLFCERAWPKVFETKLPQPLHEALSLSYMVLILGVLVALFELVTDGPRKYEALAECFLFGALLTAVFRPLLGVLFA